MNMNIFIILILSINPAITFDLSPGIPVPHAEVLETLIRTHFGNNGSEYSGLIYHYLKGEDDISDNEDIDVNILDVTSLRKLINVFEKRYEKNTTNDMNTSKLVPERRNKNQQAIDDTLSSQLIPKAFTMMEQSIYATRYRLQDTKFYRNRFKGDAAYNIAILVGSMDKILMKMDNLLREMKELSEKTHFLWYLIIYEKLLTMNVDVGYIANRIWALHHDFYESMGGDEPVDQGSDTRPEAHGSGPPGAGGGPPGAGGGPPGGGSPPPAQSG